MNLLIPYVHRYDHPDPLFTEFTYGDASRRAKILKNKLNKGDYVFFHTTVRNKKYITAYYVVDRVLDTPEAVNDRNIVVKYKNPHIVDFLDPEREKYEEDVVLFGDPITSKVLDKPLLFDKSLAEKLSLDIKFPEGRTEEQSISSATRAWRELNKKDVDILLSAIQSSESDIKYLYTILSTDEVKEIIEKNLEDFIEKNTRLIGEKLIYKARQFYTPSGRIDLLLEDPDGTPVIVELKMNKIGREAINQLRRYMDWIDKDTHKKSRGILVCKGVMPAFEEDFKNLSRIKIYCYGWQLIIKSFEELIALRQIS